MHPVLDSLFFPRKIYQPLSEKDLIVPTDGGKVSIRTYMHDKSFPTILLFHGNGEIVSDYDPISRYYEDIDLNLIVSDYRGYGHSSGKPSASSMLQDAHSVLDYIKTFLKSRSYSDQLYILGRSLGSACAIELADICSKKINGVIIESGFCTETPILKLLGIDVDRISFADENGFGSLAKIGRYNGPLLIIHAKNDEIVPYEQAKLMLEKSPSKRKKLLTISGAGHNNIYQFGLEDYFKAIENFIGAT